MHGLIVRFEIRFTAKNNPNGVRFQSLGPAERSPLLKWNFTDEVRSQLKSAQLRDDVVTIAIPRYLLGWLISDLNHAIVKRGCRDNDVIELSERLEYIEETGDGRLDLDV